jgi:K+-transporting ATPase ATPase C chain
MRKQFITGLKFLGLMTLLTGMIYPLMVTIITNLVFPYKSRGSLIERNGIIIGSELIGQYSHKPNYFRARPSSVNYNPLPSGASNLGKLNPLLKEKTHKMYLDFILSNEFSEGSLIPSEMITASASGLDPHISPEAALLQVDRVVQARRMNNNEKTKIIDLINIMTQKRQFSLLGEPRINVFLLNLKLDSLK